jgi:corrinoid protein of di/trimethylamine methyltransferase
VEQSEILTEVAKAVTEGQAERVRGLAKCGLEMQLDPLEIINEAMTPAVQGIGDQFGQGEAWLPQLVMAGNAMMAGLEILEPALAVQGTARRFVGTMVMATVSGDVHTIGKDMVITLCKANGFSVVDLGVDVSSSVILEKVAELEPDILGLSALMTTTMLKQKEVIDMLQEAGIRDKARVLVGGAPTTEAWAEEIGADGYAADAAAAADLCLRLMNAPAPD